MMTQIPTDITMQFRYICCIHASPRQTARSRFTGLCLYRAECSCFGMYLSLYAGPVGERSISISSSVCQCVCLTAREHIYGTAGPIFTKVLCRSPVAVARSFSSGVAIPGRSLMSMNALFVLVWSTLFSSANKAICQPM